MATTRIIPMHVNKGYTVAACLTDRTNYAKNPEKTANGEYVSAYECNAATVDAEFLLAKRGYQQITGRSHRNDVIAYQIRQSFKPGEITPEEANRVGYELAMRFLKGKHAFIVATHVDKKHVHNHIIWNSTTLDCTKKFRDFFRSGKAVRWLSDLICLEHGLSVVDVPARHGQQYHMWLGNAQGQTHRDALRAAIDDAMAKKPRDFEMLLKLLQDAGWEVKQGKHVGLRLKGQAHFKRLDSLGDEYTEEALRAVLSGEKAHTPHRRKAQIAPKQEHVSLLVDIQAKLQQGKGAGYARWAKVFNLKQMANTLNYLSEHGLSTYEALAQRTDEAVAHHAELSEKIKAAEKRMTEIAVLKTHIINYIKTREVYAAYRQSGYSKKYSDEHAAEIQLHMVAKKAFDELGVKKLPTVKGLQAEYASLITEKKAAYAEHRKAKAEMRELLAARANVDWLFSQASDKKLVCKRDSL